MTDNPGDETLVEGEGVNAGSGRVLRDDHDKPEGDVRSGGDPEAAGTGEAPAEDMAPPVETGEREAGYQEDQDAGSME